MCVYCSKYVVFAMELRKVCCVAVCYNVLQCVTTCCSVLQRVAVCYNVLQCVTTCCSVLQWALVHCGVV